MPVTKSAKRALRGSEKKQKVNKLIMGSLEMTIRKAKKLKTKDSILAAVSFIDRAAKKNTIHKNKAARLKSQLSKLLPKKIVSKKSNS